MKYQRLSAHLLELRSCGRSRAGFADGGAVMVRHLIATDDERVLKPGLKTLGLRDGEPQGCCGRHFAIECRFIGVRADGLEVQTKARQQLCAITRGGTQD